MAASSILLWYLLFALFVGFVVGVGWMLVIWGRYRQKKRREHANLDPLQPGD